MTTAKKVKLATVEPVVWTLTGPQASEFCRYVRAVAMAASKDDARMVLTAVHVRANGTLRLEATDSYRLHILDSTDTLPEVDVLVPAAFLMKHLPKRIGLTECLTLTFHDGRFTIAFDDETYSCRLVGGDYVNTNQIEAMIADPEDGHEPVKAYNPRLLVDVFKAAYMVSDYHPVRVTAGLDPLKPTRFEQQSNGAKLTMVLMPVKVP